MSATSENRHRGDALTGIIGQHAGHVTVEVGPVSVAGTHADDSLDVDRAKPRGEVLDHTRPASCRSAVRHTMPALAPVLGS